MLFVWGQGVVVVVVGGKLEGDVHTFDRCLLTSRFPCVLRRKLAFIRVYARTMPV